MHLLKISLKNYLRSCKSSLLIKVHFIEDYVPGTGLSPLCVLIHLLGLRDGTIPEFRLRLSDTKFLTLHVIYQDSCCLCCPRAVGIFNAFS